jgi:hypothetical protein
LRLGSPPASLVHVIQDNINENVCRIVDARTLDSQGTELLRNTIPTKKLSKIDAANLQSLKIFEYV